MEINQLQNLLNEFRDDVKFEYDLKKKNWFNIGGKSKVYYRANNLKDLIKFLKKINENEKIFILGAGSNTLITDNLYNGVVIKLSKDFNNISLLKDDIIIAGSGVLDKTLSEFALKNNFLILRLLVFNIILRLRFIRDPSTQHPLNLVQRSNRPKKSDILN